jgi:hypothetical protein
MVAFLIKILFAAETRPARAAKLGDPDSLGKSPFFARLTNDDDKQHIHRQKE